MLTTRSLVKEQVTGLRFRPLIQTCAPTMVMHLVVLHEELSLGAINVSSIFLANVDGGFDVSLHGSLVNPVAFSARSHDLVISLTEQQRVDAIAISGTPGGDGGSLVANVLQDIVAGYGTRGNRFNTSISLQEIPDTTRPSLLSASINLGTGVLILTASEFIDSTPKTHVDPSLMTLVQDTEVIAGRCEPCWGNSDSV